MIHVRFCVRLASHLAFPQASGLRLPFASVERPSLFLEPRKKEPINGIVKGFEIKKTCFQRRPVAHDPALGVLPDMPAFQINRKCHGVLSLFVETKGHDVGSPDRHTGHYHKRRAKPYSFRRETYRKRNRGFACVCQAFKGSTCESPCDKVGPWGFIQIYIGLHGVSPYVDGFNKPSARVSLAAQLEPAHRQIVAPISQRAEGTNAPAIGECIHPAKAVHVKRPVIFNIAHCFKPPS